MQLNKRSKIILSIGLIFIITNPSITSFSNYSHNSTYSKEDPKRVLNLFIFSIYSQEYNSGNYRHRSSYIGILGNFIKVGQNKISSLTLNFIP
jgi:ABC-type transport system involved in multi-copper enzyme maturation permease subunit